MTQSVFNQPKQKSIMDYINTPQQAVSTPNVYGVNTAFLQGNQSVPSAANIKTPHTDMAQGLAGGDSLSSAFNWGDALSYGQQGIGVASGLMGIYGQLQSNSRANEAMKIARADHQLNVDAADQYKQFRADTKSAFA